MLHSINFPFGFAVDLRLIVDVVELKGIQFDIERTVPEYSVIVSHREVS